MTAKLDSFLLGRITVLNTAAAPIVSQYYFLSLYLCFFGGGCEKTQPKTEMQNGYKEQKVVSSSGLMKNTFPVQSYIVHIYIVKM